MKQAIGVLRVIEFENNNYSNMLLNDPAIEISWHIKQIDDLNKSLVPILEA